MSRRTSAKQLRRRVGVRPEYRTVVVFTEGKETECDYISALMKLPSVANDTALSIDIDPGHGIDPLTLVRHAAERLQSSEVDECWCVFDVEWPQHHAHLEEARALASQKNVKLAISNPCFELWLILHSQLQSAFIDTGAAQQLCKALDKHQGKSINASEYMPKIPAAVKNAETLQKWHERNGTVFPDDNPSSGMAEFVRAIGAI